MKKNVGELDKKIRLILAVIMFPLLFLSHPLRWLGLASIPLLVTGLTGRCGAYAVLGKSTCKIEEE